MGLRQKTIPAQSAGSEPGGPCFNCGKDQKSDRFCYGCSTFVCDECEMWGPFGRHAPSEHLTTPNDIDVVY